MADDPDPLGRGGRAAPARRVARSQHRVPGVPDPRGGVADRRRPAHRVRDQGDARGQTAHLLGRARPRLRRGHGPFRPRRPGRPFVRRSARGLPGRPATRRAGPGQLAGPDRAAAHLPRRPGYLPGHRAVGHQPRRPRQPPARRLRRPDRAARPDHRRAGATSRRLGLHRGDQAAADLPPVVAPSGPPRAPPAPNLRTARDARTPGCPRCRFHHRRALHGRAPPGDGSDRPRPGHHGGPAPRPVGRRVERRRRRGGTVPVAALLGSLPVAVLARAGS